MAEKTSNVSNTSEKLFMQLNASELSAIIMKGSPNSNDRDAGFCSGSSEGGDDLSMDHSSRLDPSSPTDGASDDSVEVKALPMALIRNKRKSSEPSKVICEREETTAGPLKKRIRYTSSADSAVVVLTPPAAHSPPATPSTTPTASLLAAITTPNTTTTLNPSTISTPTPPVATPNAPVALRSSPWERLPHELMSNPAQILTRHPGVTTLHRLPPHAADVVAVAAATAAASALEVQQEPLALVLRKNTASDPSSAPGGSNSVNLTRRKNTVIAASPQKPFKTTPWSECGEEFGGKTKVKAEALPLAEPPSPTPPPPPPPPPPPSATIIVPSRPLPLLSSTPPSSSLHSIAAHCSSLSAASSPVDDSFTTFTNTSSDAAAASTSARPHQRNYKNMTRERRIEANARERTRVHTISAAYETLRQAVPSYSNSQKLSKLSVLRVACSYILTLSRMVGLDYSEDQSAPSIASCFEAVTATIQTEGKLRKKKDE